MVNQNSVNKNRFHQTNESRKTNSSKANGKGLKTGFFLLVLLVFLGSASILLEYLGIVNLVSSFGRGGRPSLQLGFWHLTDIADDYWARPFINGLDVDGLVQHKAIAGYPNDEFRPEQPVTRAEFAAMLYAAFGDKSVPQTELKFQDVSSDFWAASAIAKTTAGGFWQGYSDQTFRPHQTMSRVQALAVLTQGLKIETESSPEEILTIYQDADLIDQDLRKVMAAATEAGLVVNHGDRQLLPPN